MKIVNGAAVPDDWAPYLTQVIDGFEQTHLPLWFTRTFNPTGGANTLSLNFFDQPLATLDLFNATFPLQFHYKVFALGAHFRVRPQTELTPTSFSANFNGLFDDLVRITDLGRLQWTIGTKNYGPFPLWKLAAGAGIFGNLPTYTNIDYAQLGAPWASELYTLKMPLVIPMNTQVGFVMDWPAGTVPTTVTNIPITLCLEGLTARQIQ